MYICNYQIDFLSSKLNKTTFISRQCSTVLLFWDNQTRDDTGTDREPSIHTTVWLHFNANRCTLHFIRSQFRFGLKGSLIIVWRRHSDLDPCNLVLTNWTRIALQMKKSSVLWKAINIEQLLQQFLTAFPWWRDS